MEDVLGIATVPAIIVICYLAGMGFKSVAVIKDELIPVFVGICGGVLGVISLLFVPDFPAHDIVRAIAVGVASGLASTGVNQIWKQATTPLEIVERDDDDRRDADED